MPDKHPGPWRWSGQVAHLLDAKAGRILSAEPGTDPLAGRMIAAAPEMVEALGRMRVVLPEIFKQLPEDGEHPHEGEIVIDRVRILAKIFPDAGQ